MDISSIFHRLSIDFPMALAVPGARYGTTALSSAMGVHLVGSVGGGDMPCCITVLTLGLDGGMNGDIKWWFNGWWFNGI